MAPVRPVKTEIGNGPSIAVKAAPEGRDTIRMDLGAVLIKAYGDPFHPSKIDVPRKLKAGAGIIARIRSLSLSDLHFHGCQPGKPHKLRLRGDLERLFLAAIPSGSIQKAQVPDPVFPQFPGFRYQKRAGKRVGACGPEDGIRLFPGKSSHRLSQYKARAQTECRRTSGLPGQSPFHFTSCCNKNP